MLAVNQAVRVVVLLAMAAERDQIGQLHGDAQLLADFARCGFERLAKSDVAGCRGIEAPWPDVLGECAVLEQDFRSGRTGAGHPAEERQVPVAIAVDRAARLGLPGRPPRGVVDLQQLVRISEAREFRHH